MLFNPLPPEAPSSLETQVAMHNDNPYQPPRSINDPLARSPHSVDLRIWKKIFLLLLLAMVTAMPLFIASLFFANFVIPLRVLALLIVIGINGKVSFICAGFTEKTRRSKLVASAPWFLIWAFIQIALNFFVFAAITLIFARS